MKKTLTILFILVFNYTHKAQQNLVPNGSFEYYKTCPYDFGINNFSNDWLGILSPDLFNSCSNPTTNVSVPLNGFGYQVPKSGQGYSGSGIKESTFYIDAKEYPFIKLSEKLIIGKKYNLSLYCNLANSSALALDKISAVFVVDTFYGALNPSFFTYPITNFDTKVDFKCDNCFFDDTLNWIKLENEFYAKGNEEFLIIGSFDNYKNQKFKVINDTNGLTYAYYYFDDVSLIIADDKIDDINIPEIITPNDDDKNDVFMLNNFPFKNNFNIQIFNRWGNEVFQSNKVDFVWDGRFKNEILPFSTYFILITATKDDGNQFIHKGIIQLIK